MFWVEIWKIPEFFFIWKCSVLELKVSIYLNRRVFVCAADHFNVALHFWFLCIYFISNCPCIHFLCYVSRLLLRAITWDECVSCLRSHYENTPIQLHCKFCRCKYENIKMKIVIFFLFMLKNIDCRYSLEPPCRGGSNEYPQAIFCAGIRKILYIPVNHSFTI